MVLVGGGRTKFDPDGMESDSRTQFFGGFGAFGDLGERFSWRADFRAVKTDGSGRRRPVRAAWRYRIPGRRFPLSTAGQRRRRRTGHVNDKCPGYAAWRAGR